MKRSRLALLCALPLLLIGVVIYGRLTTRPPTLVEKNEPPSAPSKVTQVETEVEKTRRQLLGVWQDDYGGKRTMTLNEDGAATMVVELSGAQAFLFAPKLRFDMQWSWDGKVLVKKSIGGEPADKVNLILNTMGNTSEETILEITADRLLLLDKDGQTKYDWRRPKLDEPQPK